MFHKGGRLEDWLEFEPMDGSETATKRQATRQENMTQEEIEVFGF